MIKVRYQAYTQQGSLAQGTLAVKDLGHAVAELKKRGLWIISLKRKGWGTLGRLGLQDLVFMFRQLALMLSGGIPLLQCLQLLQQEGSGDRRRLLKALEDDLKNGQGLAESLESYQGLFPAKVIRIVRAGEMTGCLDETLDRLAGQLEREQEIRSRIYSALLYPGLVFCIATVAFFILIAFIFPRLTEAFARLNAPLSPSAMGLLSWHRWFWKEGWKWLGLVVGSSGLGIYIGGKVPSVKIFKARLLLGLPWVGQTYCQGVSARLARTLNTLLSSGVPLLEALDVVTKSTNDPYWRRALDWVQLEVSRGQTLAGAMAKLGAFPSLVIKMIHTGEESGQLETVLDSLSRYYEDRIQAQFLSLSKILEPVLVLGLGVLVGLLVMSLLKSMVAALNTIS